jgi:UDP-3-O-[3-hydroxymyristoyl] glucosamine N-acyltransferase
MGLTVDALIAGISCEIVGDIERMITDVSPLDKAGPTDLTFVADRKNLKKLPASQAGVVIVNRDLAANFQGEPTDRTLIFVEDAYDTFLALLIHLRPPRPRQQIGISDKAHISDLAQIGKNVNVHPEVCIGDDVVIGDDCELLPGVCVGEGCRIGNRATLHPHVVLYPDVEIGDDVIIHAGVVIGADGFGYRFIEGRHERIPHIGGVRIENDVEIGSCTTIDRAMLGQTVIGAGTKLDNQVMIAHNCELGRHNIMVSQIGMAGSVTTGDYVVCAGQVGIADHLHLGTGSTIGPQSGVVKDVPDGETFMGSPAMPVLESKKVAMSLKKVPEMRRQLRSLERQVAELTYLISRPPDGDSNAPEAAA